MSFQIIIFRLCTFDSRFVCFVRLVNTSITYLEFVSHFGLFLTNTKVRRFLACLTICYRNNDSVLSVCCIMRHLVIYTDSCGCLSPGAKSWLLHHSNASAHTSLLVRNFVTNCNTVFTRLGPLQLFLLQKLKRPMKGRKFATIEEM